MADNPDVPDLKKALENKPAGFAWAPTGPVAKAAASVNLAPAKSAEEPKRGKAVLFAALLLGGSAAFGLAAWRFAGTPDSGGSGLSGAGSTPKIRFARPHDPNAILLGAQPAGNDKMRFDLIAGKADKDPDGKAGPDGKGVPGENGDGAAPMNYDESGGSKAGSAGGGGGGASGAGGKGGANAGGDSAGVAAPRLSSTMSGVKFRGMQRLSSTAGFRGIQGKRGILNRTVKGNGSSSNSADSDYGAGGASGRAGYASAGGGGGTTGAGVGAALAAAGLGGGGGGANGGGSGGGGGIANTDGVGSTGEKVDQIKALSDEASKLRDQAEKDKKIAIAFKATGQDPQAIYYYAKYDKEKKQAQEKEDAAKKISESMTGTADDMNAKNQAEIGAHH